MRMLTVSDSDIIDAVGFDPTDKAAFRGTLGVTFKSSPEEVYLYKDVRYELYFDMTSAESIGKAFHDLFKKQKYPFTKSARATLQK